VSATAKLKTKAASGYCGFAEGTFVNMRYQGKGPAYYKIGGAIRYAVADLDAWLAQHRVETLDTAAR
jgi:predicted DNA-binding transcriptional regulator AlpA